MIYRRKKALFLRGALASVTGDNTFPVTPEAQKEFWLGQDAVASGMLVINDPDALRIHIGKIEAGEVPA